MKQDQNSNKVLQKIRKKYKKKQLAIFIVGAGALANFIALGLSELNLGKITIIDKDEIQETNLNRQVLYAGYVGEKKANILARKLHSLNPINSTKSNISFIDEKSKKLFSWFSKPDIIIDCVDNFKTRAILNKFAVTHKIMLISGGTSPFAGQVIAYVPGKTACLNCVIDIERLANEREQTRRSCIHAPEASVITSNQIIGGLMAGEIKRILEGHEPLQGMIKYMSKNPIRVGIMEHTHSCDCHKTRVSFWNKMPFFKKKNMAAGG